MGQFIKKEQMSGGKMAHYLMTWYAVSYASEKNGLQWDCEKLVPTH